MSPRTLVLLVFLFFAMMTAGCAAGGGAGTAAGGQPQPETGSGAVAPPVATRALCVVHCDPVPEPVFPADWSLLEELVATADSYGVVLSLHFTGSYAAQCLAAGKEDVVRGWVRRGHAIGAHPHPEYEQGGRWIPFPWKDFPRDRIPLALAQTTEAVNRLAGAENNRVLDTLLPLYLQPFDPPPQYTHFAWGNNGHSEPVAVVCGGSRSVTGVFYRTVPGDPVDTLHLTFPQMVGEFRAGGSFYGPVLHPADFRGATRRELTAWFQWLRENRVPSARLQDFAASPVGPQDPGLRLWVEPVRTGPSEVQAIVHLENNRSQALTAGKLTVYLPPDYPNATSPAGGSLDPQRQRLTWTDLSLGAGDRQTFALTLRAGDLPAAGHPISACLDVYLTGPDFTPHWAMATLAGPDQPGWFPPFESCEVRREK